LEAVLVLLAADRMSGRRQVGSAIAGSGPGRTGRPERRADDKHLRASLGL